MTLIEVLFAYREMVSRQGRAAANAFLSDAVDKDLMWHIQGSVSDAGNFIDAYGQVFDLTLE